MRILITGAGGQLGRSLRAVLSAHEVLALGHAELDISDAHAVRAAVQAHRPEFLLNAAAYNRVDDAESASHVAHQINADGPRILARATAEVGAAIVHVSTDYVFDGKATRPYHESDRPSPRSVYGASKLAGEEAVREANARHWIVRTAWVYHEEGQNFPRTMLRLRHEAAVRVVRDQVGSPTYAPHLAAALAELITTREFGTYHLAGHGEASWYELTCQLYRRLAIPTPVVPVTTEEFPRPAERPRYSALGTIKEPTLLLPPWEEGLAAFCAKVTLP